jgi:hypothetical protein
MLLAEKIYISSVLDETNLSTGQLNDTETVNQTTCLSDTFTQQIQH